MTREGEAEGDELWWLKNKSPGRETDPEHNLLMMKVGWMAFMGKGERTGGRGQCRSMLWVGSYEECMF